MPLNNPNAWWMDETIEQKQKMTERFPFLSTGKNIHIAKTAYIDHRAEIKIGDKVTICDWCKILTHDYSPVHVKGEPEKVAGITIGNNVFIGIDTIILPGVDIGDNIIVGAGSVVSRNLTSNAVYAGNPAVEIKKIHV